MDLALGRRLRELPGPILVTGHTGFKGTWLSLFLEDLRVPVIGLSLPPLPNSLYSRANRLGRIPETFTDIRNLGGISEFLEVHRPSAVIHMAAQPLVIESYKTPRETFEINVMGTVNILTASFNAPFIEAVIVVATDKVYKNDNSVKSFVESDSLYGKDPYSASKVGAEAAIAAWQHISKVSGGPVVVSVRSGNVIGGGDWADNRLLPDLIRGFVGADTVVVRNPESTRPWQHVLDPLKGYALTLEAALSGNSPSALNFGPESGSMSVREVVEVARKAWPSSTDVKFLDGNADLSVEAIELRLDSELARRALGWKPKWNQTEAVAATVSWWNQVINNSVSPEIACRSDIEFALSL